LEDRRSAALLLHHVSRSSIELSIFGSAIFRERGGQFGRAGLFYFHGLKLHHLSLVRVV
jgi:hypothetical protein